MILLDSSGTQIFGSNRSSAITVFLKTWEKQGQTLWNTPPTAPDWVVAGSAGFDMIHTVDSDFGSGEFNDDECDTRYNCGCFTSEFVY